MYPFQAAGSLAKTRAAVGAAQAVLIGGRGDQVIVAVRRSRIAGNVAPRGINDVTADSVLEVIVKGAPPKTGAAQ